MNRPPTATGLLALTTTLLAAALVGCSSSPAKPAASGFDPTTQPGCMHHQRHRPTATDETNSHVARHLSVLRYYTTHGPEPFCDHKPATPTDLTWMRYYVTQGADPTRVSRWLRP